MAIIQSGATTTLWTIDPTSTAGRVTAYDINGNAMCDISSLSNILNALNAAVTLTLGGQSTIGINVVSTSGTLTLSFEATIDNINWVPISATPIVSGVTGVPVISTVANGQWFADASGFYAIRTRVSAFTSGSMTVSLIVTPGGSKNISQAITSAGSLTITGTVTANQGTANTLGNAWPVEITDGTNVLGTSSHPVRIDPTGTTTQPISGTVTANAGTGTFAVSGTVDATQSGTWTVQPGNIPNTTPWLTTISQGGNTATVTAASALKVDGSAVTQPVSGTVTANAGTGNFTNTSIGATASAPPADATYAGALVTTSPQSGLTTGDMYPLNMSTTGLLRVDGSNVTQPISGTVTANAGTGTFTVSGTVAATQSGTWTNTVTQGTASNLNATVVQATAANLNATVTGTVTSNQGTANSLANAWPTEITDGTHGPVAVKAASTAAIATDISLVVAMSPNSTAAKDRTNIGFGTQMLSPIGGSDNGISRISRMSEFGTQRTTSEVMLWHDAIEGTTVNVFWTQSNTTMTTAQTTGVLTLNNSNITTLNTDAIITSQRQFPKYPRTPLFIRFRANITANAAANHTLVEMGLGAPSGITATINNGVFYRWTAAGNLNAVFSFNGVEQSTQVLAQGTISTTEYYYYDIIVDDDYARFIVSDSSGATTVDTQVDITNTVAYLWSISHLPSFARTYVDATGGGTAIKLNISAHSVQIMDDIFGLTWAEQSAMSLRSAQYSPTVYTGTPSFTTDANTTPSVSSGLNAFGGEFLASTYPVSTSALLEHFAYQVPTPYSLVLTGVNISPDVVSTAFTGGPVSLSFFLWVNASTANTSTATGGTKIPLGTRYFTATQAVGNVGSQLMWTPKTPLVCLPGTFIIMGVKAVGTAATVSVVRHVWTPEGYFT